MRALWLYYELYYKWQYASGGDCLVFEPTVARWRRLMASVFGGKSGGRPLLLIIPCNLPYNWEKSRKISLKVAADCYRHSSFCRLGRRVTCSLDWPADSQLLSAKASGECHHSLTSPSAFQISELIGENWHRQILLNLLITKVPRCVTRKAKTLGFWHLQLPDVSAGSEFPDTARIGHHAWNKMTTNIKETPWHAQPLSCLLSDLMYVNRPGQLCIEGHPKITQLHRPTRLGPRTAVLAGAFGCVSRPRHVDDPQVPWLVLEDPEWCVGSWQSASAGETWLRRPVSPA